jgi:uncharacterized membrane protein YwzB
MGNPRSEIAAAELIKSFRNYIQFCQKNIGKPSNKSQKKNILRLLANEAIELETFVNTAENHPLFKHLVRNTKVTFSDQQDWIKDVLKQSIYEIFGVASFLGVSEDDLWTIAVSNFFRNSFFYLNVNHKRNIDMEALYEDYYLAFHKDDVEITYLAPLDSVKFGTSYMDFGEFKIQKFREKELEALLKNRINKVFYSWSTVDIKDLKNYWFLYLRDSISISEYPSHGCDWIDNVKPDYTGFPQKVESALQIISLYNWLYGKGQSGTELLVKMGLEDKKILAEKKLRIAIEKQWMGFNIPYIIRLDDILINFPKTVPNDLQIKTEYKTQRETLNYSTISLSKKKSIEFEQFIKNIKALVDNIRMEQDKWEFVDIALGYFVKAFFSKGLEELLWHITAIEALLGEKREVVDTLARRISIILGETEKNRDEIRKLFKDFYDFRCSLVHGKKFKKSTQLVHLNHARHLSRLTLLWFLHYLNHIKKEFSRNPSETSDLPGREDILTFLDIEGKKSKFLIRDLVDRLPYGFPTVKKWFA